LADNGIISGYSDNTFRPDRSVTRAEALKIMMKALDIPLSYQNAQTVYFNDVDPNAWYRQYVQTARDLSVINGFVDGSFRPDEPLTRLAAWKILLLLDKRISAVNSNDYWYFEYARKAKNLGLADGLVPDTELFNTNSLITRGVLAKTVFRLLAIKYSQAVRYTDSFGELIKNKTLAQINNVTSSAGSETQTSDTESSALTQTLTQTKSTTDRYAGTLNVSSDTNTPMANQILMGSYSQELFRFRIRSDYADTPLEKIRIETDGGLKQISQLYLYNRGQQIGAGHYLTSINNSPDNGYAEWRWQDSDRPIIPRNSEEVISVYADMAAAQTTGSHNGQEANFKLSLIEVSGPYNDLLGRLLTSNIFIPYDILPKVALSSSVIYGDRGIPTNDMKVFGFAIKADENSKDTRTQAVRLDRIKFTIDGYIGARNFRLYREADDQLLASVNDCRPSWQSATEEIIFDLSSISTDLRRIDEGQSQNYYLRTDVYGDKNSSITMSIASLGSINNDQEIDGDIAWSAISGELVTASSSLIRQSPNDLVAPAIYFSAGRGDWLECP
ncbi:MAG: S-layer homology domain-containing protein, partial [Patescibacteria group bacterium]|nr:S-layer homology domain-containing protein [Patescibacteria group bacterium]